jgi:hypothetical protein
MTRRQGAIAVLLVGLAAAAAMNALARTAALRSSATKPEVASARQIAQQAKKLDAWAVSLTNALASRPPQLPSLPRYARVVLVKPPTGLDLPRVTQPAAAASATSSTDATAGQSQSRHAAPKPAATPKPRTRPSGQTRAGHAPSDRDPDEGRDRRDGAPPSSADDTRPVTVAAPAPSPPAAAPAAAPASVPAPAPTLSAKAAAEQQCEALKQAAEKQGEAAKQEAERQCEALKRAAEGGG